MNRNGQQRNPMTTAERKSIKRHLRKERKQTYSAIKYLHDRVNYFEGLCDHYRERIVRLQIKEQRLHRLLDHLKLIGHLPRR